MKHDAVVLLFFCIYPNVHLKYTNCSVYFIVALICRILSLLSHVAAQLQSKTGVGRIQTTLFSVFLLFCPRWRLTATKIQGVPLCLQFFFHLQGESSCEASEVTKKTGCDL